MKLIERFTESKSGNANLNEDGIYFDENFAAVIDGTTDKDSKLYGGVTAGRFATLCILKALEHISPLMEPYELLSSITNTLNSELKACGYPLGPSAGIVLYNAARGELISYGDNPYRINTESFFFKKENDILAAKIRSDCIKDALASGVSVEQIQSNDIGRKKIVSSLKHAADSYANKNVPNGYPVINGTDIIKDFITVHKIAKGADVILASDGYPKLFKTLDDTEEYLFKLLEKDILCINELIGTKGVALGNISFDDRSYLKIQA